MLAERLYLGPSDTVSVAGRSLAWKVIVFSFDTMKFELTSTLQKLFFAKEEPLQASLPPRAATLLDSIRDSRTTYAALLAEKTRAPDTIHVIGSPNAGNLTESDFGGLNLNNPLSLHDEVHISKRIVFILEY